MTELGISTEVRPLQPENAANPMEVTELGISVFLQPATKVFVAVLMMALQLSRLSYVVLPESTTIVSRPLQPENAEFPMEVTESGISTEVRPLQY